MEMTKPLPARQKEVLSLIASFTEGQGYPPTLADLATSLGLKNRMTVHQHVAALRKKGLVHWEPGLNRSLRVLPEGFAMLGREMVDAEVVPITKKAGAVAERAKSSRPSIPLVGNIAAGAPIDAIQADDHLEVESRYGDSDCFALKVKGESMIEDGIYDGDFVIVKPEPSPRNGDVVVALLDDGNATLKRFFKEKGGFRLQPANSSMEPIFVSGESNLTIQGKVVGLFRSL